MTNKSRKTLSARRTTGKGTDSPTARQAPITPEQPALPEGSAKPLCDIVASDINDAVWSIHKHGVERLQREQRTHYERWGHAPSFVIAPPVKEAHAIVSNAIQAAGVAEREAVIGIVGAFVDADTLSRIAEAVRKNRGPISTTNHWAAWSKVGESKDGKAASYIMALNLGTDYALAK